MEVVLLGTGTPLPTPDRAGPATLIRAADQTLLVDCGRGVLMRMAGAFVRPNGVDAVLITHLHSDHTSDFNDLLTMFWASNFEDIPLKVIGPPGTADWIRRTIEMMRDDIGYRIAHHADLNWQPRCDVTEVADGVGFQSDALKIVAAEEDHGPVKPAIGFRVEAEGKAVVVAGDTCPCPGLDRLCEGADAYVQTVLREDLVKQIPAQRIQDILTYHSSVQDAANTAKRCGVGQLLLTHMLPFCPTEAEPEWRDMARSIFNGTVVVGPDLTSVTL